MTVDLIETCVESLPFAPEQTLERRIADLCDLRARADRPHAVVAAFSAGETVYLILTARQL